MYAFAEGGPATKETRLLTYIDRFGAQAILGRPLSALEAQGLLTADAVLNAHSGRERAENWADWESKYPKQAELLAEALIAATKSGLLAEIEKRRAEEEAKQGLLDGE